MPAPEIATAAGLAYRSAGPPDAPVTLFVHGYPESSYMWREALDALARAGHRGIAPDLPGFGDSPPDPPGTWEHHMEALERFVRELELDRVALVTHDWGVLVGLRWACDHPGSVRSLTISDGGFFADRRWHDLANVMRTPGEGEKLVAAYTREAFDGAMRQLCGGIGDDALTEYWKGFADETRRRGHLELYRSGDFEKLAPYEGRLAELGLPTLILWGAGDNFASVKMAERFQREIPASELHVIEQAGHFVWEDAPEQTTAALVDFLALDCHRAPLLMASIAVTEYTDPGCPWAYSASPALAVLQWRYRRAAALADRGDRADRESPALHRRRLHARECGRRRPLLPPLRDAVRGGTPASRGRHLARLQGDRRDAPARPGSASATSCARCSSRGSPPRCSSTRTRTSAAPCRRSRDSTPRPSSAAIDDPATLEAYEQDRRETRTAEGGATDYQGKARQTDGPVRYSAPSLVLESDAGVRVEAGGFQPVEAYDVLIANLDRRLERHPPAQSPLEALAEFPSGLVTEEVAAIMAPNNMPPDRDAAERALVELLAEGAVRRTPLGDDALWQPA